MVGTDAWTQVVSVHARAEGGVSSPKGVGPESVEGGKGQREGEPSGAASETGGDADGGTGSPIGELSLRGVRPTSGAV